MRNPDLNVADSIWAAWVRDRAAEIKSRRRAGKKRLARREAWLRRLAKLEDADDRVIERRMLDHAEAWAEKSKRPRIPPPGGVRSSSA